MLFFFSLTSLFKVIMNFLFGSPQFLVLCKHICSFPCHAIRDPIRGEYLNSLKTSVIPLSQSKIVLFDK